MGCCFSAEEMAGGKSGAAVKGAPRSEGVPLKRAPSENAAEEITSPGTKVAPAKEPDSVDIVPDRSPYKVISPSQPPPLNGSAFPLPQHPSPAPVPPLTPPLTPTSYDDFPPMPENAPIAAQIFTFRELERATKTFAPQNFVGEGGFGRVYKGKLESTGQIVAVKQLDRNGLQGNREFLVEVLMLSLLHHPNLVNLIGYCADGDQRLLVYEFMALGCVEDHLHDLPDNKDPLDWNKRMKIAAGAAKGLEYLHDKANPPVIYRDFKSSNILLDENWHPKLSDFGLAKLGPVGDKTHVSTRVMGTYGYCAPEYAMTGQLTLKSDVYSFGVVLLELITGRKAIDNQRVQGEHNLVAWARPLFKDRRTFPSMADPLLRGRYPMRGLYQALAVAAMCLQEQASQRPVIADVVTALSYLAAQKYEPSQHSNNPSRLGPSSLQSERERKERERREMHSRSPGGLLRDGSRTSSPRTHSPRNGSPRTGSPKDSPDKRATGTRREYHHERRNSGSPTSNRVLRENQGRPAGSRMAPANNKAAVVDHGYVPNGRADGWQGRQDARY